MKYTLVIDVEWLIICKKAIVAHLKGSNDFLILVCSELLPHPKIMRCLDQRDPRLNFQSAKYTYAE
jgi:hypothetical protein